MSFVRSLDEKQIAMLYDSKNIDIYTSLQKDVISGEIFPAVRKNEIHFYYKGGCLYKFSNGTFKRDKGFDKYATAGSSELSPYEKAKKEVEAKFTNTCGKAKERRLLDALNAHTFCSDYDGNTVALDIEVNLNGTVGRGKKCDLVLYNKQSKTLMFVEGKVFCDSRVNVKIGYIPEVIEQVATYSEAIAEQEEVIVEQYGNHVNIINNLFGTFYEKPRAVIKPAKLLVYDTPLTLTSNNSNSIDMINSELGDKNVVWFKQAERPSIDMIWNELCK